MSKDENPILRAPEKLSHEDKHGRFIPDPTPLEVPIDHNPGFDLFKLVRDTVAMEMLRSAAAGKRDEIETFAEYDDFDTGEGDHYGNFEKDFDRYDPPEGFTNPFIPEDLSKAPPSDAPSGETPKPDTVPHGGAEISSQAPSQRVGDGHPKAPHLPS